MASTHITIKYQLLNSRGKIKFENSCMISVSGEGEHIKKNPMLSVVSSIETHMEHNDLTLEGVRLIKIMGVKSEVY